MPANPSDVLVIGGGPAGLRAAELTSAAGLCTVLADSMRSVGRKFLVAGRGGLNLTHSEPLERFCQRYGEPQTRWRDLLAPFSPADLRAWAAGLGIETFVGTSCRVFPVGQHAAPLLRRWIERLRAQGVTFHTQHSLGDLHHDEQGIWSVTFDHHDAPVIIRARAVILALGGASWPQTGSDGRWTGVFKRAQIAVTPLAPANCGYEVDWPASFLTVAEGLPLKNITASAGGVTVAGELLITKYGLEGGALYQLGRELRATESPRLLVDLKPGFTADQLHAKLGPARTIDDAAKIWRLGPAARELLRLHQPFASTQTMAQTAKSLPIPLLKPRPIAEAISTAGGVAWPALDDNLMVKHRPGLFCCGEMIDWEAPTGGYLLQGCFSTGTRAAQGAIDHVRRVHFSGDHVPEKP